MDIQFISWNESQTQVIYALSMIISYLQRSNVHWCPTLVLNISLYTLKGSMFFGAQL